MITPLRSLAALSLAGLLACTPPWDQPVGCAEVDACTTSAAGSTGTVTPTTSASDGVQTVTGDSMDSTSTGAETGETDGSTTTVEPAAPPSIVTFELQPYPIKFNGMIEAKVTATDADGVRLVLDTGDVIELASAGPGVFSGEFPVLTGLINGSHVALLTPWQGVLDGATVEAPYEVALPEPGSQGFWEAGDLIGPGQVAAMATLPTGEILEFGTHFPKGEARCYLRRRDKGGAWAPDDLVSVLPDSNCTAIDLQVDAQGAMFVVVNRQGNDGLRWWLAKIPAWGLGATSLGIGAKGETAVALAHQPSSGTVAVCGFAPTPLVDVDAMAWVYPPNLPGESQALDYPLPQGDPHSISERTRDCVFVNDTLALVGDAYGNHGDGNPQIKRDRLFILRLDMAADTATWTIAPSGVKTQSGAQAVALDDQGRLVVAGYTCNDICQPEGDLRIYDVQGDLAWQVSLGLFSMKQLAAQDLVWSPAGYAVVATGGMQGNDSAFTVRAFTPAKVAPVWTFTRKDDQALHLALALAIGPFGGVYAGGLGANGYPAVAYVGG